MSRSFKQDYTLGIQNETKCLDLFEYYFEENFAKTPTMHSFDFVSPERYVEVKSRTCLKQTYPTTMIGYDKILEAKKSKKPVHFAFLFRDGWLWEIEYNDKVFEEFDVQMFQRDDRVDKTDVRKQYCYIPVNRLECIGQVV